MRNHDLLAITQELDRLEQQLKLLSLWGGEHKRPDVEALNSNTPFCMDTLEFHQWLEYVFLERFRQMLSASSLCLRKCRSTLMPKSTTVDSGVSTVI